MYKPRKQGIMKQFNSSNLLSALTILTFKLSNTVVSGEAECVNSPFKLIHTGDIAPRPCAVAISLFGCTSEVSSHCPYSCDSCPTHRCSDSTAIIFSNGDFFESCALFSQESQNLIDMYCTYPGIHKTCRSTCDYCQAPPSYVPTYSPSSAPSSTSSPTVNGFINVHFDENELDLDNLIGDDYYYDTDYSPFAYFHPDLLFEDFGYYPGHASPGTGFSYGLITENNVAFNEYGDPATIGCPGGSFFIESMWITSAWQPNAPVVFYGVKTDGTQTAFSVILRRIDNPVFLESEFEDFTDLSYLIIDTPLDGDVAVMDEINVGISQPCTVPESFTGMGSESILKSFDLTDINIDIEDKPKPKFAPIYPRKNLNR